MRTVLAATLTAIVLIGTSATARAQTILGVNLPPKGVQSLARAAGQAGLKFTVVRADAPRFEGRVLVWEARAPGDQEINAERAHRIGEFVREGGSLLLTLSENPGTGPMRLAFLLPTTAWHTQTRSAYRGSSPAGVTMTDLDPDLFPQAAAQGLAVPFYFQLRPFHAVERGEGRYERFERKIPYVDQSVPRGDPFWTRPLINRGWRVRLRANDVGRTPLLLTGHYGYGRVAVFASSAEAGGGAPEAGSIWKPVLQWLAKESTKGPQLSAKPFLPTPAVTVDPAAHGLRVLLRNPTPVELRVRVLARVSTWERALVGDVARQATVAANSETTVTLPLPQPGPTTYQALDMRDAFEVRLGVLSSDGGFLLFETRLSADLRPPVLLSVRTDNLRQIVYPFKAPGPDTLFFRNRMGMPIDAYAYHPGQTVHAAVTIANGSRNIAPLARARDETLGGKKSVSALNDEAAYAEKGPIDDIQAYGAWVGQAGQENVLTLTFPTAVTVTGVTLVGCPDNYRFYLTHNPGAVTIELDGKPVVHADDLDRRFVAEQGQVRFPLAPHSARVVGVRLPWVDHPIEGRQRQAPWLGEVKVDGWLPTDRAAPPAAVKGSLILTVYDPLSGESFPAGRREVTVEPGAVERVHLPVTVPARGTAPRFYRIEASFAGQQSSAPLLVIQPEHPLEPLQDLRPASAPEMGFIVTRGFRNVLDVGTGTQEIPPGWGTPDDLIWAYSRQLKQLGVRARTQANRLYVTDSDLRHYSTPWRSFPNGEYFYDLAPTRLVERMKQDRRWKTSDLAILSHSDRWDTAPEVDALHGWQDFLDFDAYLRAAGQPGLQGRTRQELAKEIHEKYEHRWQAWQLERYIHAIRNLKTAFAREGKRLLITAQGSPLVPAKYEKELAETIRGQSDDSTWGMWEESIPLTTGRQMGILAFNPSWAMSTLLQWGYDSAVLNNPHWHSPVDATEGTRRHYYDRAWRGTIKPGGAYHSMHTYGYNTNAGVSYTMTANDWQEWWRLEERHSLIAPEGPLGAGLVISTARFADPEHAAFSGSGGNGSSDADHQVRTVARTVQRLHEAGVSVPFAANIGVLEQWTGTAPLILLDLNLFDEAEVATLKRLHERGVRLAAFQGQGLLSKAAAELFGVRPDGFPADGHKVAEIATSARVPAAVVKGTNTLLIAAAAESLTPAGAQALAPLFQAQLQLPLAFPVGTAGYGFVSQGQKYVVVEDWLEQGRTVQVRLRADPQAGKARAVDVNDHRPVEVRRDGADWLIELPLRPGDGALICVEERK